MKRSMNIGIGLIASILILLNFVPYNLSGEDIPSTIEQDLISVNDYQQVYYQYDNLDLRVLLNNTLRMEDVTIVTNSNAWVKGIPPISDQLPFVTQYFGENQFIRNDWGLELNITLDDQMIWHDGKSMMDNVTITLAFLCIYNGTQDLETVTISLIDINDRPNIKDPILIPSGKIRVGEEVSISAGMISDPDMDYLEITWELDSVTEGTGKVLITTISQPGTHTITLIVDDGNLTDRRTSVLEVLPVEETKADINGSTDNATTQPKKSESDNGSKIPFFIVIILILLILIVLSLGLIRKIGSGDDSEEMKDPPRRLWSMSPLRGPSRYERAVLKGRLRAIEFGSPGDIGEEKVLEDDLKRWDLDWDFDTGF